MTTKEAIKILEYANKWRRGVDLLGNDLDPDKFPMPDPKEWGLAIDYAVELMKRECESDMKIYATYDTSDGEVLCAFVDKDQCEREAKECGCGMQTIRLVNKSEEKQ